MVGISAGSAQAGGTVRGLMSASNVDGFVSHVVRASYPGIRPLGLRDGGYLYGMKSAEFPNVVMLVSVSTLSRGDWKWCRSVFPAGMVVDAVSSNGEDVMVSFRNAPTLRVQPELVAKAVTMAAPSCLTAGAAFLAAVK